MLLHRLTLQPPDTIIEPRPLRPQRDYRHVKSTFSPHQHQHHLVRLPTVAPRLVRRLSYPMGTIPKQSHGKSPHWNSASHSSKYAPSIYTPSILPMAEYPDPGNHAHGVPLSGYPPPVPPLPYAPYHFSYPPPPPTTWRLQQAVAY